MSELEIISDVIARDGSKMMRDWEDNAIKETLEITNTPTPIRNYKIKIKIVKVVKGHAVNYE